ncbi:MAG: alpha/beta fold hydrolase [Bacteroidia bacterium]
MARTILITILTMLWGTQIFPQTSSNFNMIKLADGVYTAINQPGGKAICNAGIIDLGGKTVIFDPFLSLEATEELIDEVLALELSPIAYVVNSHWHNDHVRGNQAFDEDVKIITTEKAKELIIKNEKATIASEKAFAPKQIVRYDTLVKNHPTKQGLEYEDYLLWLGYYRGILESHSSFEIRYPDLTFEGEMVLSGTERSVRLISEGKGHTDGDLVAYLPEERILFSGDLIFNEMHPFISDGDPDLWLKNLEKLDQLELGTIIPGHGPMGDRGHLVKMVSYLEELIAIRDTLDENQNLNEVPLPKGFQNWHFPEFFRANLGFLARQNLESDQVFQEVGEIENENGIIHYKLRGRGTPILMLSSGPGYSGEYLTPVAGMLGRTDQIILPDLRGTGRSAVRQYNQETINLKNIINDLDSLRKYLELDEWVLLGHGFGGMLAMEYAARFPENTQALILTNSGGTDLRFLQYFGDNYERNLSKSNLDSLWYWENDIRKKNFPIKPGGCTSKLSNQPIFLILCRLRG